MNIFRTKCIETMLKDAAERASLKRELGPIDLTLLGIGTIIGAGIFVLTASGALIAGPALSLSFVIAAMVCGLVALCYAELASIVPVAGSAYTYSYATLGELPAWIIGWSLTLEYGLAVCAVAAGWSGYLNSLLTSFGINLPVQWTVAPGAIPGVMTTMNVPASLIILAMTFVLAKGIRESARLNTVLVFIKLVVIVLFIIVGMRHVSVENWQPFLPNGVSGILQAASLVFFAFIGFDVVASAAEETRNPQRNLPIGIIASLVICALLYVVVSLIMTGIVPFKQFAGVDHPMSLVLQHASEQQLAALVDLAATVGMLAVILVLLYGQVRLVFAMARDGLLPEVLASTHARNQSPRLATWLVGIILSTIAAFVPLAVLTELVCVGTLCAFMLVSVGTLVLRRTHPNLQRPFRCPWVPLVPLLAVGLSLCLLSNLGELTWIAAGIWFFMGLLVYFIYSRHRSQLNTMCHHPSSPDVALLPAESRAPLVLIQDGTPKAVE